MADFSYGLKKEDAPIAREKLKVQTARRIAISGYIFPAMGLDQTKPKQNKPKQNKVGRERLGPTKWLQNNFCKAAILKYAKYKH